MNGNTTIHTSIYPCLLSLLLPINVNVTLPPLSALVSPTNVGLKGATRGTAQLGLLLWGTWHLALLPPYEGVKEWGWPWSWSTEGCPPSSMHAVAPLPSILGSYLLAIPVPIPIPILISIPILFLFLFLFLIFLPYPSFSFFPGPTSSPDMPGTSKTACHPSSSTLHYAVDPI